MLNASDIMSTDVITVRKETSLKELARILEIATLMTDRKIYTIPVMDGECLVGVIGKADLIRTLVS